MAEKMNLTPEQQEAVSEIDRNLQIIACAGSGKTGTQSCAETEKDRKNQPIRQK